MTADGFARGHQVARAVGIAVPLGIFLVWWSIWGGRSEVASESEVAAKVVERQGKTCLLRTTDGQVTRLLCPGNLDAGMDVRLRRAVHADGEVRYSFAYNIDEMEVK